MQIRTTKRSARARGAIVLAAAMSGAGVSSISRGQTLATWINPVSGSWTDATRWSTNPLAPDNGNPPGSTYDVFINVPGSYTVTLRDSVTINSLTLAAGQLVLGGFNTSELG